jgi:predicted DNA-binding WGR domain protein
MELIQTTNLHYHDYKSDKVYYAELCKLPKSNLWNINFAYGRRGNNLVTGTKNDRPLNYFQARSVYDKLVDSKVKKGYRLTNEEVAQGQRIRIYASFARDLLFENYITDDEYATVNRMLYSNDPETVKLAEVLIQTKEQQRWEQN